MSTPLVIGTRSSKLALWQTEQVDGLLRSAVPALHTIIKVYSTSGDEQRDVPCSALADNAFTDRIEQALLHHDIDIAVHSYKDLPFTDTPGLVIAAVPVRADVRDALVARNGATLATLPAGAIVGTSSDRRAATIRALRPDLAIKHIRGAVDERLRQLQAGDYDAVIFAVAGLERLGLASHITEYFDPAIMPPAPGQGALAVQCRTNDQRTQEILAMIDDVALHNAVRAERGRPARDVVTA